MAAAAEAALLGATSARQKEFSAFQLVGKQSGRGGTWNPLVKMSILIIVNNDGHLDFNDFDGDALKPVGFTSTLSA